MSNLAQEEADRFFSHREHHSSHPEDRDNNSDQSDKEPDKSNNKRSVARDSDQDLDEDTLHNMSTLTTTKQTFHLPSTLHHANTGPKGVIADAQSFARAKQTTFRQRLTSIANTITSKTQTAKAAEKGRDKSPGGSSSEESDLSLSEEEADSEFMKTWRANRLQELSAMSAQNAFTRRISPSRRTWGTLTEVDAIGYLDAIEKVSDDTVVVVMIFDPTSARSLEVEDELNMLAYKYSITRFVKLHHDIAEMETVEIPAVLAYQKGDVFATISGAKAESLEEDLKKFKALD